MRREISEERRGQKHLQKDLELVRMERDNFEELYREMIVKYKQLVQNDIQQH